LEEKWTSNLRVFSSNVENFSYPRKNNEKKSEGLSTKKSFLEIVCLARDLRMVTQACRSLEFFVFFYIKPKHLTPSFEWSQHLLDFFVAQGQRKNR